MDKQRGRPRTKAPRVSEWSGLGERLRQAIRSAGYTQENGKENLSAFAVRNMIMPSYVFRWANDEITPSRENLERLGQILKVNPWWLQWGDEVNQAPIPPRKRARKVLGCLAGALLATAAYMVPAEGGTLQQLGLSTDDAPYRKRRRAFPDTVFLLSAA